MDGLSPAFRALPEEAPLAMPVQDLHAAPALTARPASAPPYMVWRRLLVIGGAVGITALAAWQMYLVLGVGGLTALELVILALFVSLFAWIALALVSAVCGVVSMLAGGGRRLDPPDQPLPVLVGRTALLMPTYNEDPGRVMAALQVIHTDLARHDRLAHFDIFILSDTTDPDAWVAEEAAFLALRERVGAGQIFYRRRHKNIERKAGNISEWVRRFGAAYPHFLILDADSVMTAECIVRLAGALERTPDAGLIQTLPVIVGGETLFARMQQFAGRVYGPVIAHGIAWWHGAEGNYWGHNAMIRTRAFAEAAGLPTLPGRKPFGGHVLSHDFVEAALLRRAGWAVHMMPALRGSYEEGPPGLADIAVRDRRWCQGNLQHVAILPTRGLHPISRLHLLMGIGSYVTAPLWLLFLITGILISLQARFVLPEYFGAGPTLFPLWPAVDPVRSKWVFIGTMGVLLGPKLLSFGVMLFDRETRVGCGGAARAGLSVLTETVLTGLIAPVAMLTQSGAVVSILSGRDGGWQPQRRDDGSVPFRDTLRRYRGHTAAGLALGVSSYLVSPSLFLWMIPVVAGLALSIPLAAYTARRSAGALFRRLGLLRTPEETAPPPVLLEAEGLREAAAPGGVGALERLRDPALLAAHRAMLPPPRRAGDPFDPALLMGLAKLREGGTAGLSRAELAAVLGNAEALALAIQSG